LVRLLTEAKTGKSVKVQGSGWRERPRDTERESEGGREREFRKERLERVQ
jgi:hypothetical protein